jgi:hypothetical protein
VNKEIKFMDNVGKLVILGRFMTANSARIIDDQVCNSWARVGKMLMEVGVPFAPQFSEFATVDRATVLSAARALAGKLEMPALFHQEKELARRTRRARMSNAMSKKDLAQHDKKSPANTGPKKHSIHCTM